MGYRAAASPAFRAFCVEPSALQQTHYRHNDVSNSSAASLFSYHGVIEPIMCEILVTLDARVPQ
jgi:hypothetical protein